MNGRNVAGTLQAILPSLRSPARRQCQICYQGLETLASNRSHCAERPWHSVTETCLFHTTRHDITSLSVWLISLAYDQCCR